MAIPSLFPASSGPACTRRSWLAAIASALVAAPSSLCAPARSVRWCRGRSNLYNAYGSTIEWNVQYRSLPPDECYQPYGTVPFRIIRS